MMEVRGTQGVGRGMRPAGHGGKLLIPSRHQLILCHVLQLWAYYWGGRREISPVLVCDCLFVG